MQTQNPAFFSVRAGSGRNSGTNLFSHHEAKSAKIPSAAWWQPLSV
jgi:hypothetical protein